MKKIKFALSLSLLIPFAFACDAGNKTYYVTFHQDNAADVRVLFTSATKQSEIQIQEPDIVKKKGYSSCWEDYSIEGKNESFTVNALYNEITYYATFKAKGEVVEDVAFNVHDIVGEHPQLPLDRVPTVPTDEWTNPYWEDYTLDYNNIVVRAMYDDLKTFTVSFSINGTPVGSSITIDRSDLDVDGNIDSSLIPEEVKNAKVEGYEVSWNFNVKTCADQTIEADVHLHKYYVKFVDFNGDQVGELVPYTLENKTWESINKPDAPTLTGYDTYWNDTTLTYSDTDIPVATPNKTGKKYLVSFEGFADKQEVTYGSPYTLSHQSGALKEWVDESGEVVPNEGVWNTADNVSLTIQGKSKEDFKSLTVPSFVDVPNSFNIEEVAIAEGKGMDNSNALKFKVKNEGDFGLKIKKSYLDEVFADSGVKTLSFLAKGSSHTENWRHKTAGSNVCYEINNARYGLDVTYKRFSFTRAMYESHVDSDFVIYGGSPSEGADKGMEIYIDCFTFYEDDVMNDISSKLGFENGGAYRDGGNIYFASVYKDGSELKNNGFYIFEGAGKIESFGYSNDNRTEGAASMTFTKTNGYIAFFFGSAFKAKLNASETKAFAFDIYSTVWINSNANVKNLQDGCGGHFADQGGKLPDHQWTTFTMPASRYGSGTDTRFLIIQGSTAGTFYIDNMRILSPEEI